MKENANLLDHTNLCRIKADLEKKKNEKKSASTNMVSRECPELCSLWSVSTDCPAVTHCVSVTHDNTCTQHAGNTG